MVKNPDNIITFPSEHIDVAKLKETSTKKLAEGLIAPAVEQVETELVSEHTAEPIKSMDDIFKISDYLISNGRYRDNMLFIVGINFGLRISDLRMLRFCNLINDNFTFKDSFKIWEKKTRNTRKRKKNRYISINRAVIEAVTLYLEHTPNVSLSDYMFTNASRNRESCSSVVLSRQAIDKMLKDIAKDLDLNVHMSTHTLRKTFCYHQMVMSHNDTRKLMLLQKMLGHATLSQTLDYIGITEEEMEEAYQAMNLGSKEHNYLIDSEPVDCERRSG